MDESVDLVEIYTGTKHFTFRMAQYNAQKSYMVMEPQNNYHPAAAQGNYPPPPLLQHMNGSIPRFDVNSQQRFEILIFNSTY